MTTIISYSIYINGKKAVKAAEKLSAIDVIKISAISVKSRSF